MRQHLRRIQHDEVTTWLRGSIPGFLVIALVITLRLSGSLEFLELSTLDNFLRLRPTEPVDERIVIVGINEDDIRSVGTYPIPDKDIAALITKLQNYKPRAIGLDIVRDISVPPGHSELVQILEQNKNIIGVEKILPPYKIYPPPNLPQEQVGFSDIPPDKDGKNRRALLGNPTHKGYKFSFSLRLATDYLSQQHITLENGIYDHQAMRFASTEIPRLIPNTGGYIGEDEKGVQTLINFRNASVDGVNRFRTLSLNDVKTGKFDPKWISDRIVLIGMTTSSVPDLVNTGAIPNLKLHGQINGVEFHAHNISQILSAVLDKRPLLKTLPEFWEYVWILVWGLLGIIVGWLTQSLFKNLLVVGFAIVFIEVLGYLALIIWGYWLPITPVLLILAINAVGLSAFAFYQHDKSLKSQNFAKKCAIEMAFNNIHNGPLQTLIILSRDIKNQDLSKEQLQDRLQTINLQIREIGENLTINALHKEESLIVGNHTKIDLKRPIHDLLYEVFSSTLERDFPYFKTLKVKIRSFEPITEQNLNIEQKREICQFLEEALCNVGKHAQGLTRISATGTKKDGYYRLTIKDNGSGIRSFKKNKGTKQCKDLAKRLGGKFIRKNLSESGNSQGTLCELIWPLNKRNHRLRKISLRFKNFVN